MDNNRKNILLGVIVVAVVLLFVYQNFIANDAPTDNNFSEVLNDSFKDVDCSTITSVGDVLPTKNHAGCNCLDESSQQSCRESVSNSLFYEQAVVQANVDLCKEITIGEVSTACTNIVGKKLEILQENSSTNDLVNLHYSDAIPTIENLLESDPENVTNLNILAIAYANKALTERSEEEYIPTAIELIEKSKSLDDEEPSTYYAEGFIYEIQPDLDKSLASYNKALELDPNYVPALAGRAHLTELRGDIVGALNDLARARELDANNETTPIYASLCRIGTYIGNADLSVENCSIVVNSDIAVSHAKAEAYQILGSMYMNIGDYDKSRDNLELAETYSPNNANLFITWADFYLETEDYVEAENYARKAIATDSTRALSLEKLADALFGQVKYDDAIVVNNDALVLVQDDIAILAPYKNNVRAEIYSNLADVYEKFGDEEKEKEYRDLSSENRGIPISN